DLRGGGGGRQAALAEAARLELGAARRPLHGGDGQPLPVRRRRRAGHHTARLRDRVPPDPGAPRGGGVRMIRVAILDHHPAMRAGLDAILGHAAGVAAVGAAADGRALWPLLYRSDPDVVLLDDLRACLAVRARYPHMRIVVYAAAPVVVAAFAGADAVVDK